jgi:hypothetical protein
MSDYERKVEVKMHRQRQLRAAEQWRLAKAARPSRKLLPDDSLRNLGTTSVNRTAAAARRVLRAIQAWAAGSSGPQKEWC